MPYLEIRTDDPSEVRKLLEQYADADYAGITISRDGDLHCIAICTDRETEPVAPTDS